MSSMRKHKFYLFGWRFLPMTRIRVAILIVVLLLATTTIGFALWDNTDSSFDDTINLGEGANLIVYPLTTQSEDTRLVPLGAFKGNGDIDYLLYTFTVVFNKEGLIVIRLENALINELEPFDLLDAQIALDESELSNASNTFELLLDETSPYYISEEAFYQFPVYIKVFFKTPETFEHALSIQQANVGFEIHFEAININ